MTGTVFALAHLNVRSLLPKLLDVENLLVDMSLDILCLTETWISPETTDDVFQINNYRFYRRDRVGRGGGVGMYVRSCIQCDIVASSGSIEQIWVGLTVSRVRTIVGCVYRPPNFSTSIFLNELENQLLCCNIEYQSVLCLGDLNIDLADLVSPSALQLSHLLESLDMKQIITEPTRITRTCTSLIDIIAISNASSVSESGVVSCEISDHDIVFCKIPAPVLAAQPRFVTYRDYAHFDYNSFLGDLVSIPFHLIYYMNLLDDKLEFFNDMVMHLFNSHAPFTTKKITKPKRPWITDNIKLLQKLRDKAKCRFRRTGLAVHWDYYKQLRNFTTLAVRNEKAAYFRYLSRSKNDKQLWSEIKRLNFTRGSKQNEIALSITDPEIINNSFLSNIPTVVGDQTIINKYISTARTDAQNTFSFRTVDESTVLATIHGVKSAAVGDDGMSIRMLLQLLPHALPCVTHIINCIIEKGLFPNQWKKSVVIPIPKKQNTTNISDLRPISLLPVLSKVLEKILHSQISTYLQEFDLLPPCQSGFRRDHSCATALLKVTDDIIEARDRNELTLLVMLDYSKAFDTIDHQILLAILTHIGMGGRALLLLRSYLTDRCQYVKFRGIVSSPLPLKRGVPQGSILGPLLFSIYTSHLHKSITHSNIHMYADDTQIYMAFNASNVNLAQRKMNQDLENIYTFSTNHALKINPEKSVAVLFGKPRDVERCRSSINVSIDNISIPLSTSARNLGLIVDNSFRYRDYTSKIICRAYASLKSIYPYRSIFDIRTKAILCESFVLSVFNYGVAVYGPCLDVVDRMRIQKVQNSCLRYIFGIRKFDRVSHKLQELHWLNMSNRRRFHCLNLYHKIITSSTPAYLSEKIRFRTDVHNINLRNKNLITPPQHASSLYERGFTYNVYQLYNSLPVHIKDGRPSAFRCALHRHLFNNQI